MPNRYEVRFSELRRLGRKALIPFTVLGYPDRNASLAAVKTMIASGASALELGIAFSDPLADGPLIQQATNAVIEAGFTVGDAFQLLSEIRALDDEVPMGLLVYYNTVLAQGIDHFYRLATDAGVDGVLIADLPAESAHEVEDAARKYGICQIFTVSPISPAKRIKAIAFHASGFVYAISRLGLTGLEENFDGSLESMLAAVKVKTSLPVCVGFGVSSAEHARRMFALGADGVITGSRIIDLQMRGGSTGHSTRLLKEYLQELSSACRDAMQVTNRQIESVHLWRG